jgi:hypothetical protein
MTSSGELAGREVYYGRWRGYGVPRVPDEPLTEEEARSRVSYYVARYDQRGRLASFRKFLRGKPNWSDEYAYWDDGRLKERVMRRADGTQVVQRFER